MGARATVLAIAIPAALAGPVLLVLQVRALLRWLRTRVLATLPFGAAVLAGELAAGAVTLAVDRPRLGGWGLRATVLGCTLVEVATGSRIAGRPTLVPLVQSGTTRIRYDVAKFAVPAAGRYRLEVAGVPADAADPDVAWILLRGEPPLLFPLRILGLVAAGAATIAGIVFTALALAGRL
jgi:hypothetical protein